MRCLVTGGCGFIGGHVTDALESRGYTVDVVDNLSAESNVTYRNESKNVNYYNIDICDYEKMEELFSTQGYELVFHLAAESRIQPSLINPVKSAEVNVVGTCTLLNLCRDYGVGRLVYSSTSSCYGANNLPPLKETMLNDNLNPYAVTKLAAEDFCMMYWKTFSTPTVSLRYFNVYGDRMPSKGQYAPALAIFMKQASEGKPLTVVGDGLQTRDFVHVSDVVEANIIAALADENTVCGQAFNIGAGESNCILDIAKMISDNIVHIPARTGESKDTLCDYSKFKSAVGWLPKIKLLDWLKR